MFYGRMQVYTDRGWKDFIDIFNKQISDTAQTNNFKYLTIDLKNGIRSFRSGRIVRKKYEGNMHLYTFESTVQGYTTLDQQVITSDNNVLSPNNELYPNKIEKGMNYEILGDERVIPCDAYFYELDETFNNYAYTIKFPKHKSTLVLVRYNFGEGYYAVL